MAHMAGWPFTAPWLMTSLALYCLAGICWLPVVWLQVRMAAMARETVASGVRLHSNSGAIYNGTMLRVVIDTDVIVSAFLSSVGASRQLLLDALDRKFALLLSTSLLVEYESVLLRPEHLKRANATAGEVIEILDALAGLCVPVVFDYTWRPTGAQADDELVVETAINGHAQALATFNLKHFRMAGEEFSIEVLHPGPLVRRLRR